MIDKFLLKKKLIYRSLHRGCKETDIILSCFVLSHIDKLSLNGLVEYEKIINLDDHELYNFITKKKIPKKIDNKIINLIIKSIKINNLV